jgi:hypothetical protein
VSMRSWVDGMKKESERLKRSVSEDVRHTLKWEKMLSGKNKVSTGKRTFKLSVARESNRGVTCGYCS